MIKCPKCQNDNQSMFDLWNNRREQVDVNCKVCAHSWIHIYPEIPKENLLQRVVIRK